MLQAFGYPLPLGLGLVVLGTLLFWLRWHITATVLIGTAVGGLYLLSTPAVASLLIVSLERGFEPAPPGEHPRADAIVVLGGGILPPARPGHSANLLSGADRIRMGARLYNAGKAPRVITTGARPFLNPGIAAAEAAADLLRELGVPGDAILAPGRSTSTREDALSVLAATSRNGIGPVLLVTSAFHMPRALATFQAVGIEARPAPTDFMSAAPLPGGLRSWLPDYGAFERSNKVWHEYAGLFYYWLHDWL